MLLTYYNNKSDSRYVVKDITAVSKEGHSNPVNITLLENTSIVNPTFKMKDVDLYMTANYVYVDELRRYYYIRNVTLSNGYAYLECSVDVLMSYKDVLKNNSKLVAIISRQEHEYDMKQNDGQIPIKQYPAKRCIGKFSTPFSMERASFVIGVIGNTTSEEVE